VACVTVFIYSAQEYKPDRESWQDVCPSVSIQ